MSHSATIETAVLVAGLLLAVAIAGTRLSARLGVPALVLFLATGMIAGSDGLGGLWFDDPGLTWSLGIVALAILLFTGGLETHAEDVRAVAWPGVTLATLGVAVSTGTTATFYCLVFERPVVEGVLLGAIVSSTDAAAVFAVLRANRLRLRGRIQSLVEMESGSNDPMAIFLTLAACAVALGESPSFAAVGLGLALQMGVGVVAGVLGGRAIAWAVNRLNTAQEGLYAVFTTALALILFGGTALVHGSGFLAVYVGGIVVGSLPLVQRRAILRFHDALAWLVQVAMFLVLGLLVFPSRLLAIAPEGLAVAAFLVLVARPAAVLASLSPFRIPVREQAMIAWVGLRGAVPIVLATWPRVAGAPGAEHVFDIVFFVVLVSVVVQGTTLPFVARWLGVAESPPAEDLVAAAQTHVLVTVGAGAAGVALVDLSLPGHVRVAMLERDGVTLIPEGATRLARGDVVHVVLGAADEAAVRRALS